MQRQATVGTLGLKVLKVTTGRRTMASGGELSCPMLTSHRVHRSVKLSLKVVFSPPNFMNQ